MRAKIVRMKNAKIIKGIQAELTKRGYDTTTNDDDGDAISLAAQEFLDGDKPLDDEDRKLLEALQVLV